MEVAVLWDGYFLILSKKKKKETNYILLKLFQVLRECADLWKIMVNTGFEMKLCFLLLQTIFEQLPNDLVELHG